MKRNCWCFWVLMVFILGSVSCISRQRLLDSQNAYISLQTDSVRMSDKIREQDDEIVQLNNQANQLNKKIEDLNRENDNLANDANNVQSQLDENRRSMLTQQVKAKQLQAFLDAQNAKSEEVRQKMADALKDFSSDQLTVTRKNGRVYVSMEEALLFPSESIVLNVLNQQGIDALEKVATVLNQYPDININVEGHTDSTVSHIKFKDNWQLSADRAVLIARMLINNYHVNPNNLIASGHSEYDPVAPNSTPEGRARNRRTDIILTPNLDGMYKLLK